jgi:hypothetical protein
LVMMYPNSLLRETPKVHFRVQPSWLMVAVTTLAQARALVKSMVADRSVPSVTLLGVARSVEH